MSRTTVRGHLEFGHFEYSVARQEAPGTRVARSGLQLIRETTSNIVTVYEDDYVEQVDCALEQFATVPSGVRSFGEMAVRRGVRRVAATI
jgi:hypothetical protein